MAKINYDKVEKIFDKTVEENARKKLLDEALQVQREKKALKKNSGDNKDATKTSLKNSEDVMQKAIHNIKRDLIRLNKKSKKALFEELGLNSEEIKKYIQESGSLSHDDAMKIKKIQSTIASYSAHIDNIDEEYSERIVKTEQRKHIDKRFNVKEGWIPS